MTLLAWKPGYETGIAAVDHEHRHLIGLINELHHQLGAGGRRASVSAFFGDLYAEIAAHFALEEKVMRARAYRDYGAHKADHERLLDEIRDLMDEYETSLDPKFGDRLRPRLGAWFRHHFQTMDRPLHLAFGPLA